MIKTLQIALSSGGILKASKQTIQILDPDKNRCVSIKSKTEYKEFFEALAEAGAFCTDWSR